jgi:opacity protein-like surface antigen
MNRLLVKISNTLLRLGLLSAIFLTGSAAVNAQSFIEKHFCGFGQFSSSRSYFSDAKDSDYLTSQFTLSPGYKTSSGLSFYIPFELTFVGYNLETTKNFDYQGGLGVGIAYDITKKDEYFKMQIASACTSTIFNADIDFLSPKLELRLGYKGDYYGVYCGIGAEYMHTYSKDFDDKLMLRISFGTWIF